MLLAVDIGNTNTVIGIAGGDHAWARQWRITTARNASADDWASLVLPLAGRDAVDLSPISGIAIASVVPAATVALRQCLERLTGLPALIITSDLELGIELGMESPAEVGADRIANAVGAWHQTREATIVVDLGTATKVEAIDGTGRFLGGAIAPGIGVTLEALTSRAARLFAVEITQPNSAIGRNTITAVQAGLVRGHIHLIRGLIQDIRRELAHEAPVLVTGGHAPVVESTLGVEVEWAPDLTLDGIRIIHQRNPLTGAT
jgi:type III pantothenate kinase